MKKLITPSLFLLALCSAVLFGCGGDSASSAPPAGSTPEAPKESGTASTPDAGKATEAGLTPGTYEWREGSGENEAYGVFKIAPDGAKKFKFSVVAGFGMNTGFLTGTLTQNEVDAAYYDMNITDPEVSQMDCVLSVHVMGAVLSIQPTADGLDDCGAGLNVSFLGEYKRISSDVPKLDVL